MNADPKPPLVPLRRPSNAAALSRGWRSDIVRAISEELPWGRVVHTFFKRFLPGETPAETGWRLVNGSLLLATTKLRLEAGEAKPEANSLEDIARWTDQPLDLNVIEVGHDFFDRPDRLGLLDEIEQILHRYFVDYDELSECEAAAIAGNLPNLFSECLLEFQNSCREEFACVDQYLKQPWLRQQTFRKFYKDQLERKLHRPLPGSTIRLHDLYLPPRAFWVSGSGRNHIMRQALWLEDALNRWLEEYRPEDARRVIAGGPGAGKSMFVMRWACQLNTDHPGLQTLLVPLATFRSCAIADEIWDYAKKLGLATNPLDLQPGEELLLILDGLDELDIDGRSCVENACELMQAAEALLNVNHTERRLRIVLTTRDLLIDAAPQLQVDRRQLLHMIGYLPVNQAEGWSDPGGLLPRDQRAEWWQKWWSEHGKPGRGVPSLLDEPRLGELTNRPVFNFLIGKMLAATPDRQTALNDVYHALVYSAWLRDWAFDGRQPARRQFAEADFRHLLEMLGIVAWQCGGGNRVSRERAATAFKAPLPAGDWPDIVTALDVPADGVRSGAPELLLHFFFQRAIDGDGYELTHPSFTDYLAACALARFIAAAAARPHGTDAARRELLQAWAHLTSPARITEGIVSFLEGEIGSLPDENLRKQRALLIALFNDNLACGNAHLQANGDGMTPFRELQRLDAAAELALLAAIGCCTKALIDRVGPDPDPTTVARIRWQPAWPEIDVNGEDQVHPQGGWDLLRRLQHGVEAQAGARPAHFLCGMCLNRQLLRTDLIGGDLRFVSATAGADFANAYLHNGRLDGADLGGASFVNADLSNATLRDTVLGGADITGADLFRVDLARTVGLTWDQLDSAKRYDADKLPQYLLDEVADAAPA